MMVCILSIPYHISTVCVYAVCVCESDKACVSRALEARNLEAAAVWFTPLGRGSLFRALAS